MCFPAQVCLLLCTHHFFLAVCVCFLFTYCRCLGGRATKCRVRVWELLLARVFGSHFSFTVICVCVLSRRVSSTARIEGQCQPRLVRFVSVLLTTPGDGMWKQSVTPTHSTEPSQIENLTQKDDSNPQTCVDVHDKVCSSSCRAVALSALLYWFSWMTLKVARMLHRAERARQCVPSTVRAPFLSIFFSTHFIPITFSFFPFPSPPGSDACCFRRRCTSS